MVKVGRRQDKVWARVTLLEEEEEEDNNGSVRIVKRWKCKDCEKEFAGGASRIKAHVNKVKGKGIRPCEGKANSNNDIEHNLHHSQDPTKSNETGKIQGDARYEKKIQVGSSAVYNGENEYLEILQYVFQCLSPGDKVYDSGRLNLSQKELITFKPGTFLVSSVIDVFVEILTESEKKKATPSNWYLPVMFSTAALVCDERNFKEFVNGQKMRENYIFHQESPEKVFIPVHTGPEAHGHFYLYIFHLNKNVIQIWDSLPNKFEAATEGDETTKKLLLAMEILFKKEKGAFSNYKPEMANDILSQDNGFDCGVFVINFMQQSDNYVKRNPSLQFDSKKEREDLALKLLNNDLNQEKQNLYDKARRHYAQVEKQDANKRLRVDTSKEYFEGVERERKEKYDDCDKRGCRPEKGPPQSTSLTDPLMHSDRGQIQGDAKCEERIQVGLSFVSNWENEDLQMIQHVFERLRPGEYVFQSPRLHLTQNQLITLKPGTWLDSWVIEIFVEILTESEKKKARPSNCYLPMAFSNEARKYVERNFKKFVEKKKIRENYLFHIKSPEKVFIPVRIEQKEQGHFYLYIFHLNKKVVEVWDSLPKFVAEIDRDETTKKLLFAMEILFEKEKGAFSNYKPEMANDILYQDNGFDCGVFVIKYMQQSDNYVKRTPLFQFDSQKEREDLALKLLNNDLNQEIQNLYDKARRHYAQVEKQDGDKRLQVDPSKEHFEDDDDSDDDDLIGKEFQRYTKQIREWIKNEKVSAIGVWGMGGSGKTALASHIYDKLLGEDDIKVIWVTVSQNSIYEMQKVIAGSIKLDISDEFEVKRIARKLFQAFKEMKKCVLFLDDVWDHFFLGKIGFPMSDNQIKLILTTRIWEVCQGMGCEEYIIKVECLHDEDSWTLFKKMVGFQENLSLEVQKIARNVAYECKGLPLAIVRIATSMKRKKQVREWSHMWKCLENLDNGQYEIEKWVLPILRSSYDFLSNKLQRFFLYCALRTKGDFDDEKADHLIRTFVHEIIDETKKLTVQYDEGYNMLDRLKNHSMLERFSGKWGMNKFLRALAIGIAEDTGRIMENAYENLIEIPSDFQWREDLQRVILTGNKIQTIPDGTGLICPQLSTLLLNDNANLSYISDDFFKNMPVLKTLDLSRTLIKSLPESVSNLKYLTALLLSGCKELRYIPSLSKLKRLMSLDLSKTAIKEAPLGLESLVNLRWLNLFGIYMSMSSSLISKLINLEHLLGPEVTEIDIQGLDNLEVITAFFRDISVFNRSVKFLDEHCQVRSFHLNLGNIVMIPFVTLGTNRDHYSNSIKRITRKVVLCGMAFGNRKVVLPGDIKELYISGCQIVGTVSSCLFSVVSSFGHTNNNPHQIERLDINDSKVAECLCCFSGSCPFCSSSQLVGVLKLCHLKDLKYIVSPCSLLSLHRSSLFSHLTDLYIEGCNSMETLMTPKLLALLQNLRNIDVIKSRRMKEIVGEDHSQTAKGDLMALVPNHLSHPSPITLPKLTSLRLFDMPQLNFVYRGTILCPSLQICAVHGCMKLNLPRIEISNGRRLQLMDAEIGYYWDIKIDQSGHGSVMRETEVDLSSLNSSIQNCASN